MPANYVLLEKVVVGAAGAASVTFNSIPQTGYTDLVLVTSTRSNTTEDAFSVRINNDSATNYTNVQINGNGSTAATSSFTQGAVGGGRQPESGYTANTFGNCRFYFPNYTSSANKSVSVEAVNENNATAVRTQFTSSVYPQTTAISSLVIVPGSGLFVQHSTFTLYGVAKFAVTPVIAPFATGGDVIQSDGTYWYHAFRSSGTFTPLKALTCDVLVVAGGGGPGLVGANHSAGGGGAGQVTNATGQAFTANTAYTTTIGGGGAISSSVSAAGSQGSTSNLSGTGLTTITATGGGGGASATANATLGGSGGGGSTQASAAGSNGTNTNAGTAGFNGTNYSGGSGGGAGGVGTVGTNTVASNGGAGINTYSTWHTPTGTGVSGFIAGGGAGGYYSTNGSYTVPTGGSGGGGNGGYYYGGTIAGATAGIANTGGGGGAYGLGTGGGAGGSGLVIIRYPMV